MRRAPSISGAVILSLAAGCGGSSPPPEEPQQVAIVEFRELPKSVAVSEKEPLPAPKEPEEPEEEEDEGDEEPEGDDASAGGVLGGVLGGGSTQTRMGPVGVLAPIGQGGVSGIGSTGLSGGTGQGFGSGGRGPASRNGTPPPTVSLGATKVTGELPPQVIRRIVQQHLVRIRFCYEKALAKDSKLEGKVTARFVIAADGSVASVSDGGSTIKNKGNRSGGERMCSISDHVALVLGSAKRTSTTPIRRGVYSMAWRSNGETLNSRSRPRRLPS